MNSPASQKRARAQRLQPDQRRSALLEAAVTLFTECGGNFTTSQLAEAADVAEGTIFRYFPDKDSLLSACQHQLLELGSLVPQLQEAARLSDLEARLRAAADDMAAHLDRIAPVIGAMKAHGPDLPPPTDLVEEMLDCVGELFAGHSHELRLPRRQLASAFAGLFFSNVMLSQATGVEPTPPATLVSLFLRGVLKP